MACALFGKCTTIFKWKLSKMEWRRGNNCVVSTEFWWKVWYTPINPEQYLMPDSDGCNVHCNLPWNICGYAYGTAYSIEFTMKPTAVRVDPSAVSWLRRKNRQLCLFFEKWRRRRRKKIVVFWVTWTILQIFPLSEYKIRYLFEKVTE